MSFFVLPFPSVDPVAFSLGPLSVRWYGLSYFFGLLLTWRSCIAFRAFFPVVTRRHLDDFLSWSVVGVVVGGRLGHVFFYEGGYYLQYPLEILQVWKGGMSFHGGLLGMICALLLFTRQRKLPLLVFSDLIACGVPIALCLGRIANFINGELYGRVTDVPWAVNFPSGGYLPRHPSQLYEAVGEGLLLGLLLWGALRLTRLREFPGSLAGLFLLGYGLARMGAEFFREPEGIWEFGSLILTYGQVLSLPLVIFGLFLLSRPCRAPLHRCS